MTRGRSPGWALLMCAAVAIGAGCGAGKEVILRTADGVEVTAAEIDRTPRWLLPPGGVAWLHVEVAPAAASELGRYLLGELHARFPAPEAVGFSLERDVTRLSAAIYSTRGADFVGVASGRFDRERIEAAATARASGAAPALTRTEYAGRSVFTAASVGFVVLTTETALFGSDTGIRRSLDRIADSRVADDLPGWVKELLASPNATFSLGADLQSSPLVAALSGKLAALRGASTARAVGNFEPPGVNLALTVGHGDHDAARATAAALLQAGGSLNIYGRLFGLGQPLAKLETQAVGSDAQAVVAVDGDSVRRVLEKFLPPPPGGAGWAGRPPSGSSPVAQATP